MHTPDLFAHIIRKSYSPDIEKSRVDNYTRRTVNVGLDIFYILF